MRDCEKKVNSPLSPVGRDCFLLLDKAWGGASSSLSSSSSDSETTQWRPILLAGQRWRKVDWVEVKLGGEGRGKKISWSCRTQLSQDTVSAQQDLRLPTPTHAHWLIFLLCQWITSGKSVELKNIPNKVSAHTWRRAQPVLMHLTENTVTLEYHRTVEAYCQKLHPLWDFHRTQMTSPPELQSLLCPACSYQNNHTTQLFVMEWH